jgi:hypothetical protein
VPEQAEHALPDDWREGLTVLARRLRDALRRHPWFLEQAGGAEPSYGPNGGRFVERALRATAPLGLAVEQRLEVVETIWEYVIGFSYTERHPLPLLSEGMERYVRTRGADGEFRELAAMFADRDAAQLAASRHDPEDRFTRNLRRLLDGVGDSP